ncbi:MAG: MTH895/ArsE family thioredoxin-like protein [Oscillospiraceae bacterium]
MLNDYNGTVKVFKAFSDNNRLLILEMLLNGELCSCKIQKKLPIQQSTLSHHMRILVESGIVNARKDGKWVYYSISDSGVQIARKLFDDFTLVKSEQECDLLKKEDELMSIFNKKADNSEQIVSVKGASVKILGTGCPECYKLVKETTRALSELNMNTDIEHITDLVEIVKYGVMSTPTLIIDGKIMSVGRIPSTDEIIDMLIKLRK